MQAWVTITLNIKQAAAKSEDFGDANVGSSSSKEMQHDHGKFSRKIRRLDWHWQN
ncbi:hypothetical protein [Paraburkholderia sediminicola]|uniref:hypothetical protein n=1 Tax=Paraburkholderia sediminicola TaxID=458836 RepID=UPI0038BCEB2C